MGAILHSTFLLPSLRGPGRPIRVCDLVQFHSPISGGVKRFILDKCRALADEAGIEHTVIVPGAEDGTDVWHRSTVHFIHSPRLIGSASYRVLHDRARIQGIVDRFQPDIIEVGDPYLTAWIGRQLAQQQGARLIGFYHSDYPRAWHRTIERFAGKTAGSWFERTVTSYLRSLYTGMDALVVASQQLERTWQERGLGPKLRLIPLGADTRCFRPFPDQRAQVRAAWGVPMDAPVVLYVGRLAREKRLDWLHQCVRGLQLSEPSTRLVFVGDGEWRSRVQGWVREDARTVWQPYVQSPLALAAVYSAADVFAHAGLGETFGLSLLEAQACGCPVLASHGSGMDETVLPVPGNALVAPDERAAWLEALKNTLAGRGQRELIARRHQAVGSTFPAARTFRQLFALYRELRDARRPRLLPAESAAT